MALVWVVPSLPPGATQPTVVYQATPHGVLPQANVGASGYGPPAELLTQPLSRQVDQA
jgi:hypothetical protein